MLVIQDFANIDIYLFDQLLKERITLDMKIFDAGCGQGRNSYYLAKNGFDLEGMDQNQEAVKACRDMLLSLDRKELIDQFISGNLNQLPYKDSSFDFIISSAVLHFSQNPEEFEKQFSELVRVLKPDGILFIRLASSIGMDPFSLKALGNRRYHLPDGSNRFLVDRDYLLELFDTYNLNPIDPIKTSLVDGMRAMTTLVCRKEQ